MTKICFPHPVRGDFETLNQALEVLKKMPDGWTADVLTDIVQYNVCYRDHLREHGIESLIERLFSEAPALKDEIESLIKLGLWWRCRQKITIWYKDFNFWNVDIQCYNINDKVTVLGHEFNGLDDIIAHCSIRTNKSYTGQDDSIEYVEYRVKYFYPELMKSYSGPYIVELWRQCPTSERDNRRKNVFNRNYLFVSEPMTVKELSESFLPTSPDFCMARDFPCPGWNFPLIYYKGEGDYMLLATKRDKQPCED